MTVLIQTSPKMMATCRRCANEVVKNLPKRPNYTGDTGTSAFDRYFPGYVGEFAVRRWFDLNEIEYKHHVNTGGRSQGSEFTVGQDSLEVKTSSKLFHAKLMIPVKQRTDYDLVVAARMNSLEEVELMGWIKRNQVNTMDIREYKVATRVMDYDAPGLRNMENLLLKLRQ